MTRRTPAVVPAVVMAVLTVLLVAPARLNGDPSPASAAAAATTSTTNVLGLAATHPHDPLTLYPRRPGAKYEESEARAGEPLNIFLSQLRILRWTVVPKSARPAGLTPADRKQYERADLVDGYAPSATATTGDLLHLVIRAKPAVSSDPLICTATLAADGTVLMPYDLRKAASRATTSTSTSEPALISTPLDVDLYFPIGARRGRVYVTCDARLFASLANRGLFDDTRPVWGLDV